MDILAKKPDEVKPGDCWQELDDSVEGYEGYRIMLAGADGPVCLYGCYMGEKDGFIGGLTQITPAMAMQRRAEKNKESPQLDTYTNRR